MRRLNCWILVPFATLAIACAPAVEDAGGSSGMSDDQVVVVAADMEFTIEDVKKSKAAQLRKLEQDQFELMQDGAYDLAINAMTEREAEARGVDFNELIRSEVTDKVLDPTPQDVAAMYETNRNRSGGKPLEEVAPQIFDYLMAERLQARREAFHDMLKAKYDLKITLDPPRVDVTTTADAPTRGNPDAPITIVEFADFQCGYCKRVHPTLERLMLEYGEDNIRYVFQDFPAPNRRRSRPASLAARCAGEQDRFWSYFEDLMVLKGDLSDEDLIVRAERNALDTDAFRECYESGRYEDAVQAALDKGNELGVIATPTFFINGVMVVGAKDYYDFKRVIDRELETAEIVTASTDS